jgi:hypothetical protein
VTVHSVIIACYNYHYSPSGTVIITAFPRRAPMWDLCPVTVAVVEHYRRAHNLCSSGINRGAGVTYPFLPPASSSSLGSPPRALVCRTSLLRPCTAAAPFHAGASAHCSSASSSMPSLIFFLSSTLLGEIGYSLQAHHRSAAVQTPASSCLLFFPYVSLQLLSGTFPG